jgi:hypothetical protein
MNLENLLYQTIKQRKKYKNGGKIPSFYPQTNVEEGCYRLFRMRLKNGSSCLAIMAWSLRSG